MHKQLALPFIFLLIFVLSPRSQAQFEVPPHLEWKTLTTPHFQIIFNAKQQELGHLYAEKLERAYSELRLYFVTMPKRTIVVINDKTDITNGYATRIPYPHIMAYPVLPGPEESLADTGDWALELLAHEYAHILNFEPANGVMKPLRYIFGNIVAPNILLPTWWKEGLAVEIETRIGQHGRLRSYFQDATLRAMVEDDSIYQHDIAQANEQIPSWPEGMRPYLFGSLMWSQMIADHGAKVIAQLNERQGGRVPYFIEAPAAEYLDRSYSSLYKHSINETVQRAQGQIKTLREAGITPYILPKNNFISVTAPAISPNAQHLVVIAEDDSQSRAIKIISKLTQGQSFLEAQASKTIEVFDESFAPSTHQDAPPTGSIQRISWYPDSSKIVYDKVDFLNRIERYSDLYTYDLKTKKTARLTHGLRGREPAVSPDGETLVFVKLSASRTQLALLRKSGDNYNEELLVTGEWQERISYPFFWDVDTLLFSLRSQGNDRLYRFSIATKKLEVLFPEHSNVRFAKKTSEGLLFTSGKNGALNLYLADEKLQTARPVTNTLTGFFTADLDSQQKEIFATKMTSQGLKVVAIKAVDWQSTPRELPTIEPLFADRYKNVTLNPSTQAEVQEALARSTLEDYSPYGYLWPQYWLPFIAGSSSESGVVISAQTSGFDPLKKHSYSLLGTWDTGLNRGSLQGSYMNQVTSLPVALLAYRRSAYLGTISNKIEDLGGTLAVLPSMFWVSKYTSLQLGWQYLDRESAFSQVKRSGPFFMLNHANYTKSGAQISPETGGGVYLGASNYIPQEGYLSHSQILAGGELYFSKFLPKNHAVMLRANAAYTPEKILSAYGVSTESLVFVADSPLPQYILRGYLRGQLYGRNMLTVNAEYRFPVLDVYRGSGTDPFFIKRLSGAVVADGAAADGVLINDFTNTAEVTNMQRALWSSGVELKADTTLGYVLPLSVIFGYYAAFNAPQGSATMFATTIQFAGF